MQRFRRGPEVEETEPPAADAAVLDGHRLERVLAEEPGVYTIYEAIGPSGRVALKLIAAELSADRVGRKRLRRLAELRASIEHPHLLPVLAVGESQRQIYLAMPLSRDPTLADLLAVEPLRPRAAVRLLGQVAGALEAAHTHRLLHRELDAGHLVVAPGGGGHALLGDFGVGLPSAPGWVSRFIEAGTYPSPEEIRGEPLGPQTNVYSLGCILVECLTGRPPFEFSWPQSLELAHLTLPAPQVTERRPDLPPALDEVVATAMAKDPANRYRSAAELATAAAHAVASKAPPTSPDTNRTQRPPEPTEPPPPEPERGIPHTPKEPIPSELKERAERELRERAERERKERAKRERKRRIRLAPRARGRAGPAGLVAAAVLVGALGFAFGRSGEEDRSPALGAGPRPNLARIGVAQERAARLRAVDQAVARLSTRRVAGRRRLAAARTPRAQATEATRLARAYGAAGKALAEVTSGRSGERVVDASRRTEQAYERLATAARGGRRAGYATARRAVGAREAELQVAIRAFARR